MVTCISISHVISLNHLTSSKLPRSHSSPSPPPKEVVLRGETGRRQNSVRFRRRLSSNTNGNLIGVNGAKATLDWSTSYQAGSSSSGLSSSEEDSDVDMSSSSRGRQPAQTTVTVGQQKTGNSIPIRRRSPHVHSSGDSAGSTTNLTVNGASFTRSRSPASLRQTGTLLASKPYRPVAPLNTGKRKTSKHHTLLPAVFELKLAIPLCPWNVIFSVDFRKFAESMLLLGTLLYAARYVQTIQSPAFIPKSLYNVHNCLINELYVLSAASCLYFVWVHTLISIISKDASEPGHPMSPLPSSGRPASPRFLESRDTKRIHRATFGYVWMSVPKNYRESSDDGIFTGLLLGPLISMALLINSLRSAAFPNLHIPAGWIIEPPSQLSSTHSSYSALEALVLSRYSLVNLSTLCSTILLFHLFASWLFERHYSKSSVKQEGERTSVPRNEGRRAWYYTLFTVVMTTATITVRGVSAKYEYGIWQHLNIFETIIASLFFQFCLYIALRMAHKSFSLGELGLVSFGGTALWLEFLNLTIARLWPITTVFIRTYRLPTPLLIFQVALVAGSLMTGFLLSPFLVLSRNYAKRPAHRFRLVKENQAKERNRRYAAFGFYIGTFVITTAVIGLWTRWLLGNRDPWLWVLYRILEGRKRWHRPALLAYWGLLGCLSVAGWNRQLARSRKLRPRSGTAEYITNSQELSTPSNDSITAAAQLGVTFPNLPNLPSLPNLPAGVNVAHVATDLLDAADKHVPTLKLNARRKFFHGLAVVMFVPGVAVDPAFTHLSFNVAFALFIFAEYIRYFAIYPFGVSIHLFMHEFLDNRDGGTAILSHFYLLTGCAGSVWLEGPSRLLQYSGILALGVGDAVASVVGKRIGMHRWSPTTSKTFEGSVSFVASILLSAWLLRILGCAEPFSTIRYSLGIAVSALLEALSDQNDNLTLPLYMWSTLVLVNP